MALYRCSFQNITRSEGRSAVAAAAYRAGEKVTNEWDGVTHDFTKKQGVMHTEILLPPEAPAEYKIRSRLWNAVEASEKSSRARLCRECLLALPVELSREQQIQLVHDYVEQNFVALGMCADVAIHDPHKSGQSNPHAHILLTVRPISATGEWEPKTQVEYRCRHGTEERGFTAAEFRAAQADGGVHGVAPLLVVLAGVPVLRRDEPHLPQQVGGIAGDAPALGGSDDLHPGEIPFLDDGDDIDVHIGG